MIHDFDPGDFLIFQLESGYGLLRVLAIEETEGDAIWHVAVYRDLFLDPDMADAALANSIHLAIELPHVALTNRAFESTQVARLRNLPLSEAETDLANDDKEISDRSVRLLLGLR